MLTLSRGHYISMSILIVLQPSILHHISLRRLELWYLCSADKDTCAARQAGAMAGNLSLTA